MFTRKAVAGGLVGLGVALVGFGMLASPASAWYPLIIGAPSCTDDGWSVTWTVRADEVRGEEWRVDAPSGYSPSGWQPDGAPFNRTVLYPASQSSATEKVTVSWSGGPFMETRSATVERPDCLAPTTTVPATTTPPTTVPGGGVPTTVPPPVVTTVPGATPPGGLPDTGLPSDSLIVLGFVCLALGALAFIIRSDPATT